MTEYRLTLGELPAALRRVAAIDVAAIVRGVHRTIEVDAPRWVQWAIRGGGTYSPKLGPRRPPPPKKAPIHGPRLPGPLRAKRAEARLSRRSLGPKKPKWASASPPAGYRQPIDTGDYAGTFVTRRFTDGAAIYSQANPRIKAGVIEEGRRAAWIPIEPLARWVERKLGVRDPKAARGVAFAISKLSSETPRPGLHVLARAHPRIIDAARTNVVRELRRGGQ